VKITTNEQPIMRTTRWALLPLALLAGAARAEDRKPNILVILCDDVGYGEFGFQGAADIPTPNIDSIAANGVKFTQGYVSGPYCSPTRAGLLTGRYQTRFGHEFNSAAAPPNGLSLDERTIANRLKAAGYATAAVGKWHLGNGSKYLPMARGFDEFYGTVANTPYLNPPNFVDSRVSGQVTPVKDDSFYTTDAYAARATDWLGRHQDEPWFLYLPFNAQHAPLQAPEKYLERFPNIEDPKRRAFSAMMSAMDDAVGAVLAKVRDLGQEENTLIFFLSDNGGPTQSTTSRNGPLRGFKATTWEGGVRVPFCVQWKGTIPAGQTYDKPVIQLDILPTCLAVAGSPVDPAWKLDGVDLLPYLTGKETGTPHETLYWRFGPQRAIRHGDYKLVVGNGGSGQPELYDLSADLGEQKDLASEQPEKVRELEALYKTWDAEQADPVMPRENPNAKKKKGAAKKKQQMKKKAEAAKV
jgi:arylsulfatase A-like enzyme